MSGGGTQRLLSLTDRARAGALQPVSFHAEESISAPYSVTVEAISDQATDRSRSRSVPARQPDDQHSGRGRPRIMQGMVRAFVATGEPVRDQYCLYPDLRAKAVVHGADPGLPDLSRHDDRRHPDDDLRRCRPDDLGERLRRQAGPGPMSPSSTRPISRFSPAWSKKPGIFTISPTPPATTHLSSRIRTRASSASPTPRLTVAHEGGGTDVLTAWHKIGSTAHGSFHLLDYDLTQPDTLPEATETTTLGTRAPRQRDVFEWPALALTQSDVAGQGPFEDGGGGGGGRFDRGARRQSGFHARHPVHRRDRSVYGDAEGVQYVIRSVSSSGHDESWVAGGGASDYANRIVAFPSAITWREKARDPAAGNGRHPLGRRDRRFGRGNPFRAVWPGEGQLLLGSPQGHHRRQRHLGARDPALGRQHLGLAVAAARRQRGGGGLLRWRPGPAGHRRRPLQRRHDAGVSDSRPADQNRPADPLHHGGSSSTFSEFSVDDNAGSELVFLHAEKDMFTEIENNETITDRQRPVHHDHQRPHR